MTSRTAIQLPGKAYKILQWTAPNGSVVRAGESVAIAVGINSKAVATVTKPTRKRPTKRRKPNAAIHLTAATTSNTTQTNTTDDAKKKIEASTGVDDASDRISIKASVDGIIRYDTDSSTIVDEKEDLVCGWIERCSHPTIIGSMCAVCGMEITPEQQKAVKHNNTMSRMTVAGLTVSISKEESEDLAKHEAARLHAQRRLSLVLDLDHTLLHATADRRASAVPRIRSLILPVAGPQGTIFQVHYVKLRPHVASFLREAMRHYEIGVYTAGTRDYAEQIVILLAREMVGAKYDQIDLDNIRRDIDYTKFKLKQQDEATKKENDETDRTKQKEVKSPTNTKTEIENDDKASTDKRKRVTFEEPLPKHEPPPVTEEDLELLQNEIKIAEEKEAEALELRKKLFGTRIVSRTDVGDLGRDVKSLKRVFPCGGSMAAVVDDREDVWANAEEIFASRHGEPPDNLLLVKPFHWKLFQGFADVNNSSGQDLTEGVQAKEEEENESDQQLLWTGDILRRIHARYYQLPGCASVPNLLRAMRKEVLSGCKIVLSGLIPMAHQTLEPSERRPAVVRYVENLGGKVSQQVDQSTTHVIGARDGTDKILAARKIEGCQIVIITWLMECWWSITKPAIEVRHMLKQGTARSESKRSTEPKCEPKPLAGSTKGNTSTDSESEADEDDDMFLEELAEEMS